MLKGTSHIHEEAGGIANITLQLQWEKAALPQRLVLASASGQSMTLTFSRSVGVLDMTTSWDKELSLESSKVFQPFLNLVTVYSQKPTPPAPNSYFWWYAA